MMDFNTPLLSGRDRMRQNIIAAGSSFVAGTPFKSWLRHSELSGLRQFTEPQFPDLQNAENKTAVNIQKIRAIYKRVFGVYNNNS